jgi:N-acetylmuramoyl-L-alanine amidase
MVKVALSYGHGSNTWEDKHSKGVIVGGKVYEEHTHNFEVGTRVKVHLVRHGIDVLEVQPPNGLDVPLKTRTDKANAWGADIYWSIHANAGDPSARGWCGFYWKGSTKSQKLAELYAKYMKDLGLPLYHNGVYISELGSWTNFHEVRETHMPACLTENGFMTNAEDFKLVFGNENGHYDKLAEAHAKAILEYFGIAYKPATPKPVETVTKDGWTKENSVWYFYKGGKKLVGWLEPKKNEWYYLEPSQGGKMTTGFVEIGGNKYFFLPNGKMAITDSRGVINNG